MKDEDGVADKVAAATMDVGHMDSSIKPRRQWYMLETPGVQFRLSSRLSISATAALPNFKGDEKVVGV